jgi:hypothetical protein
MLVTRQIPSLFNGVSQQPPAVRSPSQWEDQYNVASSVVDGIRKRSPCEHVAKISSTRFGTAHLHTINRDIKERYEVVISRTGIRVFDMLGNEKTVTAPLGWGYLALPTTAQGRFAFTAVTVADYTFIVNKTKTVAMLGVGADRDPPSDDYWWLNRPANFGAAPSIGSSFIPEPTDREPYGGGGTTTTSNPTPAPTPEGNPSGFFKGIQQTLQDLPPTGNTVGDVWKIVGTDASNFQSYYVRWSGTTWNETVQLGLKNLVDATTMPHALIRQGDGTFVFGPFAWAARRVGDEATNPNPTFVGRNIRDVFFYRNRLGFCVDENVVLSRAGDFGNFYRLTVVDYLPDEVVDIAASETKVTKMEFAVPFQGSMMLFSDQTQFDLHHEQVFSGGTVSLDVTTEYPMISGVRPAKSGSDVYFASQSLGWGQLREYYVTTDTDSHDAADVSSHVPNYLPSSIHAIVASSEYDTVCLLADGQPNRIYVYRYYWANEKEKAQSAWNYWQIDDGATILSASVLNGYLILLVDREDGTYLEKIALFYGSGIGNLPFQVYLDRRCRIFGSYDASTDSTAYTLPYDVAVADRSKYRLVFGNPPAGASTIYLTDELGNRLTDELGNELTEGSIVPGNGASRPGADLNWTSTTTFTTRGDHSAYACAFGQVYTMRAVFSRQYPQNAKGESVHTGRLQLKTMSLYHADTAYFRVEVRPYGPDTEPLYTQEFPTRKLSVDSMGAIGEPVFSDDKVTFAVQANAAEAEIAIINDSHLGCCINAAEWEGMYFNRARA